MVFWAERGEVHVLSNLPQEKMLGCEPSAKDVDKRGLKCLSLYEGAVPYVVGSGRHQRRGLRCWVSLTD